jgi:hypothetical protein
MSGPFDLFNNERDSLIMGDNWWRRLNILDPHNGHITLIGQTNPDDKGVRVSFNLKGDPDIHLTDQNLPKGDPNRHP